MNQYFIANPIIQKLIMEQEWNNSGKKLKWLNLLWLNKPWINKYGLINHS
jgi:hypothetical protein